MASIPLPQYVRFLALISLLAMARTSLLAADRFQPNFDESKVPAYTLPDPLVASEGQRITTADLWRSHRRGEVRRLFESEVYGRTPHDRPQLKFITTSEDRHALAGRATRKEITIEVSTRQGKVPLHLLLYVPNGKPPVPAFLGLNFCGNQAVHHDPAITMCRAYLRARPNAGIVNNHATEATRGFESARWQVEEVVGRGYAVASMCLADIEPDSPEGISAGVRPLFYRNGQTKPKADEWGTIGAWAWGLSRALDYLEIEPLVDARRVAVWGHSRLGKTALWAGAQDERFAMVISNESGCAGAALSRRAFGETVARITSNYPFWFCRNFKQYSGREGDLPIDQHELIALVAPRPVYVASASEDLWADPRGEFLSAKHAEPVYALFGLEGLGTAEMPPTDHPVGRTIGYHIRTGKHDATAYDWQQFLNFADRHLRFTAP
ncbi:MAG: acetylxylan esterase [Pirellulales bacterium]|nr:acetylxylan esterase [Pirellulales bacterium]